MTRHLHWVEARTYPGVELDHAEVSWLLSEKIVEVRPTSTQGIFDVVVGNVCGVVTIGDLRISIDPKLPVNSIIWMLLYARTGIMWRPETSNLGTSDLIEGLAEVYASILGEAVQTGLLRGYQTVQNTDLTLRGRIRMADQMSRHFGQLIPLELEHDDYNHNVPENSIMRSAIDILLFTLTSDQHQSPAVRKLQRLRRVFADVQSLRPGELHPEWKPTRLNGRFQPAIILAELIIEGSGLQIRYGQIGARGIILHMWEVFEVFIAEALRREIPGLTTHTQFSTHLDDGNRYPMRPDIVLADGLQVTAVMDTKYKKGAPQAQDLYQALSYALNLGLKEATLVYPQARPPESITVTGSDICIHIVGVDLSLEPEMILHSVRQLARLPGV